MSLPAELYYYDQLVIQETYDKSYFYATSESSKQAPYLSSYEFDKVITSQYVP